MGSAPGGTAWPARKPTPSGEASQSVSRRSCAASGRLSLISRGAATGVGATREKAVGEGGVAVVERDLHGSDIVVAATDGNAIRRAVMPATTARRRHAQHLSRDERAHRRPANSSTSRATSSTVAMRSACRSRPAAPGPDRAGCDKAARIAGVSPGAMPFTAHVIGPHLVGEAAGEMHRAGAWRWRRSRR